MEAENSDGVPLVAERFFKFSETRFSAWAVIAASSTRSSSLSSELSMIESLWLLEKTETFDSPTYKRAGYLSRLSNGFSTLDFSPKFSVFIKYSRCATISADR